jgi:uncharacterized damage-inducible protein DinB
MVDGSKGQLKADCLRRSLTPSIKRIEEIVVHPGYFSELYTETYRQIKSFTKDISQAQSLVEPFSDTNCLNWLVGHIVVARCNFLMFLNVPSIWGGAEIRRYIPGSTPILDEEEAYSFEKLLLDLDRTQEQLTKALDDATLEELGQVRDGQTIGEHLAYYQSHEAQHTGQIELVAKIVQQAAV